MARRIDDPAVGPRTRLAKLSRLAGDNDGEWLAIGFGLLMLAVALLMR